MHMVDRGSALADLQQELRSPGGGSEAIPTLLKDFAATAERWAAEGVAKSGIAYRPRTLSAHLLPVAASLATYFFGGHELHEAADVAALAELVVPFLPKSVTVRVPSLWGGPKYLEFIADWYDYKSS